MEEPQKTAELPDNSIADASPQPATVSSATSKKTGKLKIIIIAVTLSAVIVAAVVLVIVLLNRNTNIFGSQRLPYEHKAYFVPESAKSPTKYALVDENGKELTEYNIEKYDQFIFGSTIVKTTDGWGIMNDSGRMVIGSDEYDALSRVGGLYTALKPGSSERKLLNNAGRVVASYSSSLNTKLGENNSYGSRNALAIAIKRDDETYDIYDARGKKINTVESKRTPIISSVSATSNIEDMVTVVSYSGGLIAFRNNDFKELIRTTDSKKVYYATDISYDDSQFVFKEVASKPDDDSASDKKTNYAVYINGTFKEIGTTCSSAYISSSEATPKGYISCNTENGQNFLDQDAKPHIIYDSTTRNRISVIDTNHYATYLYGSMKVRIGDKEIDPANSLTISGNDYLVRTNGVKTIYDKDGEKVCEFPSTVDSFRGFNKNGIAIVSESQTSSTTDSSLYSNTYHLVNRECHSITENYNYLAEAGDYYIATKHGDTSDELDYENGLIDKEGKVRLNFGDYKSISRLSYNKKVRNLIQAKQADGSSTLFNENIEKLFDFNGSIIFNDDQDILIVYGEKFINYYTLSGAELRSIPAGEGARSKT